ncbi:hypothetical protein AOC05_00305 [Arthrobacter alpinus]|uniref:Transposase n=1 Tax=Arthrobacter alpinus TaxID=656366 RepID=A0A0M4QMY8_9MICC|nr:DUF6262 family protein [Arthrobacter alpinus]ALE91166.1 hypothetical protein AOC05_00305 [Arthrobacter alpinus]
MTRMEGAPFANMVSARQREADRKQAATASTINRFLLDGTLITITAVAGAAGVSRNFIYSHETLLHQLEAARQTQADAHTPGQRLPTNGAPGRTALQAEIALAHQTIKRLRQDLAELKKRHEHCLGEQIRTAFPTEAPSTTAENLEIERLREKNRLLNQQVTTFNHRIDDLLDDLTAERRGTIPWTAAPRA